MKRNKKTNLKSLTDNVISKLPNEVRSQLMIHRKKESSSSRIIDLLDSYGGEANVDKLIVGLYKKYGVIQERHSISALLSLMKKRGEIDRVKCGVYALMDKDNGKR